MPRINTTGDAVKQSSCTSTHNLPENILEMFLTDLCEKIWNSSRLKVYYEDEFKEGDYTWHIGATVEYDDSPADEDVYVSEEFIDCYDADGNDVAINYTDYDLYVAIREHCRKDLLEGLAERDAETDFRNKIMAGYYI